jgi:hypothetical protein
VGRRVIPANRPQIRQNRQQHPFPSCEKSGLGLIIF